MPLFMSEIGVTRDDVSHKTLDELHGDPEVESYQFVMKSVRDNGSEAVRALSARVDELGDRVHHQRMRIALLRKGLVDNTILRDAIAEHQKYVTALEGHVSGLEHNIEVLKESLVMADTNYRALQSQSSSVTSRAYNRLKRTFRKPG